MAQPGYLSPRPSPHPLQNRRGTSSRKSALYQSPATPARPLSRRAVPSYASATATSASRKRARPDASPRAPSRQQQVEDSRSWAETPCSELGSTWAIPTLEVERSVEDVPSGRGRDRDLASPEPFVNTRYNLAGGLDTPGVARETYFDQSRHDDYDGRRRWTTHEESASGGAAVGRLERRPSAPNGQQETGRGWGQFVFNVAGKMWSFGSSAFKGFYAGGGQGYNIPSNAHPSSESSLWESVQDTTSHQRPNRGADRGATPVPGSYPAEDDYAQRPAKKVHMENGQSPWVMVSNPMEDELLPRRSIYRPPPPSKPTSNRRSLIPVSRRTNEYLNAGSPAVRPPSRGALYTHTRTTSLDTPLAKPSPLSPEAQKFMVERRREARQQDMSIKRMNDQLKALLREGKQALGTKIDVLDDAMGDEGYFEDNR